MGQSSLEILDRLVAFPTVSRDSNRELTDFVAAYLRNHGVASHIVPDETERKANLFASIGPPDAPGVILSGHTDVVPVEGQAWTSDPFKLRLDGGRAFGRGTADMKGFVACVLSLVPRMVASPLQQPLHIALSHDEEIGCVGVRRLLPFIAGLKVRPGLCIVGEPTSLRVVLAHKGKVMSRVSCTGREGHSSTPARGLNAIHLACDMIAGLRAMQSDLQANGVRDDGYEAPVTTIHVGVIHGGTALNIVPKHCRFDFEVRHLPHDDPNAVMTQIRELAGTITARARRDWPEAAIAVEVTNSYPGLETPADLEMVRWTVAHSAGPGGKAAFGTEGGLFSGVLGIPTLVCGPGDVAQAHKPDEYLAVDQLDRCCGLLGKLIDHLSRPTGDSHDG